MSIDSPAPPFTVTTEIINLVAEISLLAGAATARGGSASSPQLRRIHRLRSIHSSLAIENNSLTLDQVSDVIRGKRVAGPADEILEVRNAYAAYERLQTLDPYRVKDLLAAHRTLMDGLSKENGRFRSGGVGVFSGNRMVHMAPPAGRVPELVADLLSWTRGSDVHPLIKSCIFHYEFEYIHPFSDGNRRMGRLWQTLILGRWNPVFFWLPVESIIRERQQQYYAVLAVSAKETDSRAFIEYLLTAVRDAMRDLDRTEQVAGQVTEQAARLLEVLGNEPVSGRMLMERLGIRHRPTFRDNYLLPALAAGLVEMTVPGKPNSSRQMYRRSGMKTDL